MCFLTYDGPASASLAAGTAQVHLNHIWTLSYGDIWEMWFWVVLALWHRKANWKELEKTLCVMPLYPPRNREAELRPKVQNQTGQEAYLFEKNLPLAKAPAVSFF